MPTPGVTQPYRFQQGQVADADQVNANFDTICGKISGNLVDGDISQFADLDGNKLSSNPSKLVPGSRLANGAADSRVLANSQTVSNARAVGRYHIQDGEVIANAIGAGVITAPKMKYTISTLDTGTQSVPTGGDRAPAGFYFNPATGLNPPGDFTQVLPIAIWLTNVVGAPDYLHEPQVCWRLSGVTFLYIVFFKCQTFPYSSSATINFLYQSRT